MISSTISPGRWSRYESVYPAQVSARHVLLGITVVGANVTYGVWFSCAARDPRHLPFALRGVKMLDDRLANPAAAWALPFWRSSIPRCGR